MILKKGSRGQDVRELQEALKALNFNVGNPDGVFGGGTEDAVEAFQESVGTYVDGIVGKGTLREINEELVSKGLNDLVFEIGDDDVINEPSSKLEWVRVDADIFPGRDGYDRLTLRSDAADSFKALREEIHSLGGIVTTAGGKRGLSGKASPSRSKKSMHYTGLAFDLSLPTGMQNAHKDPYVVVDAGDRHWEVWCRTENEEVPEVSLESCVRSGKNLVKEEVTGRFFSFTAIAKKHGWERIRGRRSFYTGGSYTGAEWWHFQWEQGLKRGESKFGEELLKVYSMSECKNFVYWDIAKNCVFGVDWF